MSAIVVESSPVDGGWVACVTVTDHGASRELYVDNAKIYHAKALQLACTQLNIQL